MKAIQILLQSEENIQLPVSYQYLVQSLFYACWERKLPELHDGGVQIGKQKHKLFCFSRLEGRYTQEGRSILFTSPMLLELRSGRDELVNLIAEEMKEQRIIRLGANICTVCDLQVSERLVFSETALIKTRTPITVHETLPEGKTLYLRPGEPTWEADIHSNLISKLKALQMEETAELSVKAVGTEPRKQVAQFKQTYITGYTGMFLIETNPEAMQVLYYCGLGNRNSQGFGMFDIIE